MRAIASPAGRHRRGEQRNKEKPDPWPEDHRQSQYEPTHKPPSKEHSGASPNIVTLSRYKSIEFLKVFAVFLPAR
jgi:hypothetical protein